MLETFQKVVDFTNTSGKLTINREHLVVSEAEERRGEEEGEKGITYEIQIHNWAYFMLSYGLQNNFRNKPVVDEKVVK